MVCLRVSVVPVGEGCSEQGRDGSVGVLLLYCCSHWSSLCRGSWWVMDSSVVATWAGVVVAIIAAIASAILTGVTIWWPWHTRGRVAINPRKGVLRHADKRLVPLIAICGFRRPTLFVDWRNDGDGTAHAIKLSSDDSCEVLMMLEGPQYERGFEVVEDVALLKPGEAFVAIILPTSETARESVRVTLEYLEEPTRLEKSHVSRRILLPYRLPARRLLDIREKRAVWEYMRKWSDDLGYGSTDVEVHYFVDEVLLEHSELADPTLDENPQQD